MIEAAAAILLVVCGVVAAVSGFALWVSYVHRRVDQLLEAHGAFAPPQDEPGEVIPLKR